MKNPLITLDPPSAGTYFALASFVCFPCSIVAHLCRSIRLQGIVSIFRRATSFFAAALALLVRAALIPAARCFLVAAAFLAATLRFDPLFMVWEVNQNGNSTRPVTERRLIRWAGGPTKAGRLRDRAFSTFGGSSVKALMLPLPDAISTFSSVILWSAVSPVFKIQEEPTI
jgi:hypothetical protein